MSPPPGLAAKGSRSLPCGQGSREPRWHKPPLVRVDTGWECWQRQSWVPHSQCRRNLKGGGLFPPAPLPSHNFPFLHFLHLLLPLLFTLPKCAQAVIMVLSHHRHTACPSVPAPSRPQGPPHRAPCCPGLMRARWLLVTQPWPVGTQTSHLPMPHTQPWQPQQTTGTCS